MAEITPEHMAHVRRIARKACGTAWRHLRDDVEGAACLALALAARDWDGRGTFEGYAYERCRWRALDEIDRLVGSSPGSRCVKSPESLDQTATRTMLDAVAYTNWQRSNEEN